MALRQRLDQKALTRNTVALSWTASSTGYVDTGLSVATSYQHVIRSLVTTFSADSTATTITTPEPVPVAADTARQP